MAVDLDDETSWPLFRKTLRTTNDTPVVVPIADAPNQGDAVLVPELHVLARSLNGIAGNVTLGGYTVVNDRGTSLRRTGPENEGTIGAGGFTIAVGMSGTELQVTLTGHDRNVTVWSLYWRAIDFPVDEGA